MKNKKIAYLKYCMLCNKKLNSEISRSGLYRFNKRKNKYTIDSFGKYSHCKKCDFWSEYYFVYNEFNKIYIFSFFKQNIEFTIHKDYLAIEYIMTKNIDTIGNMSFKDSINYIERYIKNLMFA